MALDTTKTLTGVTYNGVAFPLDDGKDMLQARVDGDNSCAYLFFMYQGRELDISRLDTSNATSMRSMFKHCIYLRNIDVSHFNTLNVTDMFEMFYQCNAFTELDLSKFDTSNVTNMGYMFWSNVSLKSLDLSNFDTSKVTNMQNMFNDMRVLKSLNVSKFNTSKVTYMSSMFNYCPQLTSLDLSSFDTSNVTGISYMLAYCTNLTIVQGALNLYSVTSNTNMFYNTSALTGVTLKNIRKSLQIASGTSYGHLWELPYLINAVKELWDLSSGSQQTLTIGSANLEKIANTYVKLITPTAEQIEADPYINNKLPCEVCESTDEGAMTLTAYAGLKNWGLA